MTNQEIVAKLWNLCNVLRDDGITYHQYVTELTYILFLKMAKETGTEDKIPEKYRWDRLAEKDGLALKKFYEDLLRELGEKGTGRIQEIYSGARSNIEEPANLKKIITNINDLDWYSAKEEGLGNLYEGLLEKNANEKKSGAGQYFTPRVLIDVMTELIAPQPGERCNDPACGTFGFMIAADAYVKAHTDDLFSLTSEQQAFQKNEAFTGAELVHETHRLALMNAMLHDISGKIYLCDTLSNQGKQMKGFDVVLTNPPFGTKKGGERANRDDFTFITSNKQLNFLQHIYRSLKRGGRAAVVIPDIPSEKTILDDLLDKCNLHTILRLPTGIFYKPGVKTNVLFFERGQNDIGNTKKIWYYDLRSDMHFTLIENPIKEKDFEDFKRAYLAENREQYNDVRWNCFDVEDIKAKGNIFDFGLIKKDTDEEYYSMKSPIEYGEESIAQIEETMDLLHSVMIELKNRCKEHIDVKKFELKNVVDKGIRKLLVETEEDLYDIPSNWCWCKLSSLCEYIKAGGDKPKNFSDEKNKEYNVPVVANGMTDEGIVGYTNFAKEPANTITVSGRGTIGFSVIRDYEYVPIVRVIVIKPRACIIPKYIKYAFDYLIEEGTGNSIPQLTVPMLKNKAIPLAPLPEQKRIVDILDMLFEKLDEAKEKLQEQVDSPDTKKKSNGQIDMLRKSVLARAFRGKLGTNIETEESAIELLKSIL